MSFTKDGSFWHEEYEHANKVISEGVDAAYGAARKELESRGFICANDDRAEEFVAAIMRYLTESTESK